MIDDPTHVILSKKSITGSDELPGNYMSVVDNQNQVIDEWISGEQPHEIIRKLIAGETYHLIENKPANGYAYGKKVTFTVSRDGSLDQVVMKNDATRVRIRKVDSSGQILKGATLQILGSAKKRSCSRLYVNRRANRYHRKISGRKDLLSS